MLRSMGSNNFWYTFNDWIIIGKFETLNINRVSKGFGIGVVLELSEYLIALFHLAKQFYPFNNFLLFAGMLMILNFFLFFDSLSWGDIFFLGLLFLSGSCGDVLLRGEYIDLFFFVSGLAFTFGNFKLD